ncbi:tRNA (adenosine(37)-N6)-threonylcarbamoyltransferase complex dimerization subunit type 1 TsaB [Gordonia sp. VNQ95]|uniref:tRNA (adenosine(37)-N6)-threonylcarbamoyltransferase complex dimerization subunit type 1 TsaB n=1 Tax=Gordonia TaxID=2053 RepID=UPI0032B472A8
MSTITSGAQTPDAAALTVLVIDTATDTVVTGVARCHPTGDVEVLAQRANADGRRHAEILTTLMAQCLDEAGIGRDQIDAVVVGTGPGPFTGLRVGMATGAGFADALGISAYGVCSLDAIARETARAVPAATAVLVATDARRREVYWALYGPGGHRRVGPEVTAPAHVADLIDGGPAAVDAVGGSAEHLRLIGWAGSDPVVSVPTVAGLVEAARGDLYADAAPGPLTPLYLRRPDAVERKDQRPKTVSAQ